MPIVSGRLPGLAREGRRAASVFRRDDYCVVPEWKAARNRTKAVDTGRRAHRPPALFHIRPSPYLLRALRHLRPYVLPPASPARGPRRSPLLPPPHQWAPACPARSTTMARSTSTTLISTEPSGAARSARSVLAKRRMPRACVSDPPADRTLLDISPHRSASSSTSTPRSCMRSSTSTRRGASAKNPSRTSSRSAGCSRRCAPSPSLLLPTVTHYPLFPLTDRPPVRGEHALRVPRRRELLLRA
jgi:hypothetical protein